jgi:hypothetical protein
VTPEKMVNPTAAQAASGKNQTIFRGLKGGKAAMLLQQGSKAKKSQTKFIIQVLLPFTRF